MSTERDPERDADELDLPPLDDDGGSGDEVEAGDDLPAALEEDDGLDDADAVALDVGDQDLDDDEASDDDGDAEIDVGALDEDIVVDEERATGAEQDGLGDDDDDVDGGAPGEDDGGAEGTGEDPGDEVDEAAVPELDDDENRADDDGLADELLAESDAGIPWAAARWAPLEGAGAPLPCRAVAAALSGGSVAAAGEVLLLIEDGARAARKLPFGEASIAVALGDDALLAATARGQLLIAYDGGSEAAALGSWRAAVGASMGLWPAESASAVELAATPGRFWIRAGGALLCMASARHPPTPVRERGLFAITASRGVLVALTAGARGPAIERFRGDDEGWAETPLDGEARKVAERDRSAVRLAAAAGGQAVAITDQRRVAVSRDGGSTFTAFDLGCVPAIAFAGDGVDAPLLALVAPPVTPDAPPPTASALVVQIRDDQVSRVGEIASPADEGAAIEGPKSDGASPWATSALAWDTSREVLWIACASGLIALGRPQRH